MMDGIFSRPLISTFPSTISIKKISAQDKENRDGRSDCLFERYDPQPQAIQQYKFYYGHKVHVFLLVCGILSSLGYVIMNVLCALLYDGYNSASQTVSELSAIGASTRPLWVTLGIFHGVLTAAFGWGVWQSGATCKCLKVAGVLLINNAVIGFFWPPMHTRAVLAAGSGNWSDTLHIVFTCITVPLMILAIGFSATSCGKPFRFYSIATLFVFLFAGIMTGMDAPNISKDLPTPYIGVWERINIGAYMLWMATFAVLLLKRAKNTSQNVGRI